MFSYALEQRLMVGLSRIWGDKCKLLVLLLYVMGRNKLGPYLSN